MIKRIRLYLIGYKGFIILNEIIKSYGEKIIEEVVIGKDKGIKNDYFMEIKNICILKNICYKFRLSDIKYNATLSIAIGWRWMIDLTKIPNLIILHDSILPKYRGFNPLVSALINGDNRIGVTALIASKEYDTGDIIYQSKINISYPIKIKKAIEVITIYYIEIVKKILNNYLKNKKQPIYKQDESKATYSLWRDENDYKINWNESSEKIIRFIDAVGTPYKGAMTRINNKIKIIVEAQIKNDLKIENRQPGKVIYFENKCPVIVCGKGLLKIIEMVDLENGNKFKIKKLKTRLI